MRGYVKRKRTIHDINDDELELTSHPPTRPAKVWITAAAIRALANRDPMAYSEPSV
jgi:hypothetical protein